MIFAREVSDPLVSLIKKIDAATKQNSAKKMGSFVVFLTDEEKAQEQLKSLAAKHEIKNTILAIDNVIGPPYYRLAKEADVTVVLYNRRIVEVNYAFKKGELDARKIEQIVADLPKILVEPKEE